MSLKAFHIFFISVSVLCTFGFGIWLLRNEEGAAILPGIVSIAIGVGLIGYGILFLRKTRHAGIL